MRFKEQLIALGLTVCVSGCYTKYEPKTQFPEGFKFEEVRHNTLPDDIDILTVDEAKKVALENNRDFKAIEYSMKAAWAKYQQTLAAYYPRLYVTGGINHSESDYSGRNNYYEPDTKGWRSSAALNVEYLIFNGMIRKMNKLSAEHSAKASEHAHEDAKRLLIKSVDMQYNQILSIIENIKIAEADKEFQIKLLHDTELKFNAGTASQSDVLNFKVKVDSAKSTLIGAKYDLKNAKIILAQLMGLSESALDENVQFPQLSSDNDVALQDIKLYLDMALANRPDLKLYRENMKSNQYALYAKYGTYWPVLMANASSEFVSSDKNADNGVDPEFDSNNYTYGVSLSWDLFDGFARDNAVKEAEAILKQSEIDLESTWISVVQEVKTAYNTYIQRSQQYVLLNEIVELQKKTRDLVEIEYKTGTVELTRLNEAQKDYIVAENQMIGALIDVYNAKAQLEAAINSKL